MEKSVFYHIGCTVCVGVEREVMKLMDKSKLEIVNLAIKNDEIANAENAGVESVPAIVTLTGTVLHINHAANLKDL